MFKSIRSRVVAVGSLIVVAMASQLVLTGYDRQLADAGLEALSGEVVPSTLALARVSSAVTALRAATHDAVVLERQASQASVRQRRELLLSALDRTHAGLDALPRGGDERSWAEFDARLSAVRLADTRTWAALDAQDAAGARAAFDDGDGAFRDVTETIDRLLERQAARAQASAVGARDARAGTRGLTLTLIIAAVLLLRALWGQLTTSLRSTAADLKAAAETLARGEYEVNFEARRGDEFDEVRARLVDALEGLRGVVKAAEAVSEGDASVQVTPRGPRDMLSGAVNMAARTLAEAAQQADFVASGNYEGSVTSRGPKDRLGLAVVRMTTTLKEIASAAERLGAGDLDVQVTSKGAGDKISGAINSLASTLKGAARQANIIAAGDYEADIQPRSDRDELGLALRQMTGSLRDAARLNRETDWLKSGVAALNEVVLGQSDVQTLTTAALTAMARHLDAKVGAIYTLETDGVGPLLRLTSTYAYTERKSLGSQFRLGEGLVGQAALERKQIVLQHAPADYVRVVSGLGEAPPRNLCVVPILFKNELRGVLELGTLIPMSTVHQQYVEQVASVLAVSLEIATVQASLRTQQEELKASNEELTSQSRALEHASQELRAQQTELEQTNTELEMQMARTTESESRLKLQQKALAVTNEELEQRNQALEKQKAEIERARRDIAVQAEELAVASKYKSEFLANMSHELRTPLNSLLLLARTLRDNTEGNLNEDQRESAAVIFSSGNDLLNLINEILDLSKIEAGRMDLRMEATAPQDLAQTLVRQFDHMARSQGLALTVKMEEGAPATIVTDPHRLGQVLKNLVGNALKFTEVGGVTLSFGRPGPDERVMRAGLSADRALAIRVTDTGIGIAPDMQRIVFEAFQQADSGDRRKYGGTGLGLSISRELVTLLGGELHLESKPGVGSTFTVIIPIEASPTETRAVARPPTPGTALAPAVPALPTPEPSAPNAPNAPNVTGPRPLLDDRENLEERDRVVLIVEDDARFVAVLVAEVRRRGFKCLAALNGKDGLLLAKSFRPSGIILDINLPDTNGWMVLSALKQDVDTRHIPVHIVSAEDASLEGLRIGAIGHAHKPLRTEDIDSILANIEKSSATAQKLVLVVEDDPVMRKETVRIVGNGTVHVKEVDTGAAALAALRAQRFDLVVLDLGLPDMQGLELLRAAAAEKNLLPPVIVYTVRDLTSDEELALRDYADSIIIKDVRSQERLIDEVALFLHRVVNDLPEEKRQTIRHLYESDERLRGKQVLVVEDDMRTMFAMSKLLASHGVSPLKAANGEQALAMLAEHPEIDLVLLDMMMPVMDGYEAARRTRAQERFANLPIIALTAKAMKEDRQKCIEAGASDYLTKPVDQDRLLSLMRVWLSR